MRIEITADSATELAGKIAELAALWCSTALPAAVETGASPVADSGAGATRERGKPAPGRARRTKEEIAEDEAADRADAEAAAPTVGSDVQNIPSEKATEVSETRAEIPETKPAEPEVEKLDADEVKSYTISSYLNACFDGQNERTEAFRSLVKEFGATKFGDLKPEQLAPFKARVDALILEKVTA